MENWIVDLTHFTDTLSGLLWKNWITLGILLGTGVYLTLRMRFVQLRGFVPTFHLVQGKYSCH